MVTAPTVVDPSDWNFAYGDKQQMIEKQNAFNQYHHTFSIELAAMVDELNIEFQFVAATRIDITNKSGQVAADRQAVTQAKASVDASKAHIDQREAVIDATAGEVSQNAQQVASDKQVVAQDKQAAADSASAASGSASAALTAKQQAEALYGDLDAVNAAKNASQTAAQTATEQAGLADTARQGAVEALSDIGTAINANNEEFGIGEPTVISPALLADVIEPGDYWVATNSPADKPIPRFCWLYVRRASSYTNVIQELKARDNGWERYARTSDDNGATWSDWSLSFSTGNQINIGNTASTARAALSLGSAAVRNVGEGAGDLLEAFAGGLLTSRNGVGSTGSAPATLNDFDTAYNTGFYGTDGTTLNNPDNRTVTGVIVASDTARTYQIQITADDDFRFRAGDYSGFGVWRDSWHSGNQIGLGTTPANARSVLELGAAAVAGLTSTRTSSSTAHALTARAMNDHRTSADHDDRYYTKGQVDNAVSNSVDDYHAVGSYCLFVALGNDKISRNTVVSGSGLGRAGPTTNFDTVNPPGSWRLMSNTLPPSAEQPPRVGLFVRIA